MGESQIHVNNMADFYPFLDRRSVQQFPKKFSALPDINGSESPPPTKDNQIIPYRGEQERAPPVPPLQAFGETAVASPDRLKQLESRVNVAEKSNRALLEEVIRLQSEFRPLLNMQTSSVPNVHITVHK